MPGGMHATTRGDGPPADAGISIIDEVLGSIADERPLKDTFDLIAHRVSDQGAFDFCGILLLDGDGSRIHLAGAFNFPARYEELLDGIFRVPYRDETFLASPTSRALREGRTVVLEDALADPSYEPWRALAEGFGFGSLVSVPLLFRGDAVGVLNGYSKAPRRFAGHELATMETLALQAALALRLTLLVDAQQDTIAALRHSNEQLEHQRSVLERAHDIHLRLTDAVMSGADLQAVAQVLAVLVGRPITVTDPAGALICTSDPPPEPGSASAGRIVRPITIGDEIVGMVTVDDGDAASRDLDLRAMEHGATVLAVHVAKERVARATEERLHADFLHDLLDGRSDEARLAERAMHYGLSLREQHRVVVIAAHDSQTPAVDGTEPQSAEGVRRRDRALSVAGRAMRERMPGSFLSRLGNVVTVVVPTGGVPDAGRDCRAAAEDCRRRGGLTSKAIELYAGIGTTASDPAGYRASYDEALRCVEVMRRTGPGATMAMEDLGVLGLFLNTDRPEHLLALGHEVLGPLLTHDARSAGSLMATLESYLDRDCNLRACALYLCVHQNTVTYRLRKIEQLCRVDLRKPDDLLRVSVARLSLRLLGPR